jgi:hypothetical protein
MSDKGNYSLDRDQTFVKIVERTCKKDAYGQVLRWARGVDKEQIIWFLEQKIEGHRTFLNSLDVYYDFASQSLKPVKVMELTTPPKHEGGGDVSK